MTHPITELLEKQAAFEAKLPNGRLFSNHFQTLLAQYQTTMSMLALDCLGGQGDSVPRAIVTILGASLSTKFDLAAGLAQEVPATLHADNFADLAKTVTKSAYTKFGFKRRPTSYQAISNIGADFLKSASLYGAPSSNIYNDPALSILSRDDANKYSSKDRKRMFTEGLVFSTQDLLQFIGLMDSYKVKNPLKEFDITASKILQGVDDVHAKILALSMK